MVRVRKDRRLRGLLHQALRFCTVGLVNLVVNATIFNLAVLLVFQHQPLRARVLATVVATVSAYLLNKYWTFAERYGTTDGGLTRSEQARFAVVNLAAMVVELVPLAVSDYLLQERSWLARNVASYLVGLPLGMAVRFWLYRSWVWSQERSFEATAPVVTGPPVPAAPPVSPPPERVRPIRLGAGAE